MVVVAEARREEGARREVFAPRSRDGSRRFVLRAAARGQVARPFSAPSPDWRAAELSVANANLAQATRPALRDAEALRLPGAVLQLEEAD